MESKNCKNKSKIHKKPIKIVLVLIIIVVIAILMYQENQKITVCLDAGHGGKDGGSISANGKRLEKEDNLKVVLCIKKELEKQDVKVILTRKEDIFLSLEERCQIANKKRADCFVSIHRNSSKSGNGVEIWISQESDETSEKLATEILNQLVKTEIQTNRGIKSGTSENDGNDYFVNKNTKMPSCLIELGFISNVKDNQLLDKNLEEYAKAIADGIMKNIK